MAGGKYRAIWIMAIAVLWVSGLPKAWGAESGITIIAPWEGATLATNPVYLIGKSDGGRGGRLDVSLNGWRLPAVPIKNSAFHTILELTPGKNHLSLSTGSLQKNVTLEFRSRGGEGFYQYHDGLEDGDCRECHSEGEKWARGGPEGQLCYSCHDRKDEASYLHGPVGAGQCTICHDPHGSPRHAFLKVAGRKLCVRCHNQPGSRTHVARGANRRCHDCHDPHGSEKQFFLK